jgi:hypothetical protein
MLNLDAVRKRVEALARVIDAPVDSLPTYGHSADFGRPHIEVDSGNYHYVVCERGEELEREVFLDEGGLLYRIFRSVSFDMACSYELANRIKDQDFRRVLFDHQVALMARLASDWAEQLRAEKERILREHPFDDADGARLELCKRLRDRGDALAWETACQSYPLPHSTGSETEN